MTPYVMRPGSQNAITDVVGLRVGNAQNTRIKTGSTVLVGDDPFVAGVHVMGGAPGTRETDLLKAENTVQSVDALTLSGGSAFGLQAAAGVMEALAQDGRGFPEGSARVPLVPAAILFDLNNGGDKGWGPRSPYFELGEEAYKVASETFELGSVGAGFGATTAHLKGGLGTASAVLENGAIVGALVAVNAVGSVTMGNGPHFWAAPFEIGDEFGGLGLPARPDKSAQGFKTKLHRRRREQTKAQGSSETSGTNTVPDDSSQSGPGQNTTIAIVATDVSLTKAAATRMAMTAHDGLARAIWPSHTPMDGDLVFAVSTGMRRMDDPILDQLELGAAASATLSRAIARAVFSATPVAGDLLPTWRKAYRSADLG